MSIIVLLPIRLTIPRHRPRILQAELQKVVDTSSGIVDYRSSKIQSHP